ncbi:hypothetical protein [Brachyspira pilosicoli]|uniref:hypothetical protein n=1 Tax=Brachyspira pilosicoli TaxID=52584 RepID=UPI0018D2DF1C|nr:hypothetical protein [Brachyspira pilosicoli]
MISTTLSSFCKELFSAYSIFSISAKPCDTISAILLLSYSVLSKFSTKSSNFSNSSITSSLFIISVSIFSFISVFSKLSLLFSKLSASK